MNSESGLRMLPLASASSSYVVNAGIRESTAVIGLGSVKPDSRRTSASDTRSYIHLCRSPRAVKAMDSRSLTAGARRMSTGSRGV